MVKWLDSLSRDELRLIEKLIEADFKLSSYVGLTGESYFITKKRITQLRQKIMEIKKRSELQQYLDFLVGNGLILPIIAENILEKHHAEVDDK